MMKRALAGIGIAALGLLMAGCGTPSPGTAQYTADCNTAESMMQAAMGVDMDGGFADPSYNSEQLQQDGYGNIVSDYNAWAAAIDLTDRNATYQTLATDVDNAFPDADSDWTSGGGYCS
jgi:hypothetical protein